MIPTPLNLSFRSPSTSTCTPPHHLHLIVPYIPAECYSLGSRPDVPPRASVGAESFDKEVKPNATKFLTHGVLFNSNTIDAFRSFDVPTTVDAEANQIWGDIKSGAALADPSLLARFTLMTFSDLKKYHFYYWFGFPALALEQDNRATKAASLASFLSESESDDLYAQYTAMQSADSMCHAFLVSKGADGAVQTAPLSDWATVATDSSDTVSGLSRFVQVHQRVFTAPIGCCFKPPASCGWCYPWCTR